MLNLNELRTFPCLNCRQIINEGMQQCRFCSAPIDFQTAAPAAEMQAKINQAYSDASFLKTAALTALVLAVLGFLPFVGLAFFITFIGVLVLLIRWQIKFGAIRTDDSEFKQARRWKNIALMLWIAALLLRFSLAGLLG